MKRHVFRWVAPVVSCVALAILLAPTVSAHGGQWRGPGDSVPPGLREPGDLPPPPPPPPPTPSPTPTPPSTGPTGPTGPTTPPEGPAPTVTLPDQPKQGRRTVATTYEDWRFWYACNNAPIENLKWYLYNPYASGNPLFGGGHAQSRQAGGAMRETEQEVRATVVPALLWAMDPKNSDYADTEAAAYIALAKVTNDPAHIALIAGGLDVKRNRSIWVKDSAAIGLGLLRRTDPREQFTPRQLDKVREILFAAFENHELPTRTRGLAAISIGLLGDQPTGSQGYTGDATAAARDTTRRLLDLFEAQKTGDDLQVGLLMAVGLQPSASVDAAQRELLKDCALKGRVGRDKRSPVVRAHAALALGRLGTADEIDDLGNMLTLRKVPKEVRRSAAIGLGLLGRMGSSETRIESAQVLLRRLDRTKDVSTQDFGIIALAELLVADVKSLATDVIGNTKTEEYLLETARKRHYTNAGFAALALGLVVREIGPDIEIDAWQIFREDALKVLREQAVSKSLDARTQAAFCTALGVARDEGSQELLRGIVADRRRDKTLRGYAALGLGLVGNPTSEVTRTIAEALQERSSEELRQKAATALGLLGNPNIPGTGKDAVDLLIDELRTARTQSHKGEVVLALARVGDDRALKSLVALLKDDDEGKLTRAMACAGLGVAGDLELIPSLSRGSQDINYRASTPMLGEFLSIL